jgi:HD superfamily phosphodiesterase
MSNIVNQAKEFAKEEYAKHDPMHRWDHVEQVLDTALYLEDFYREELDSEILRLAVILHDIWYESYDKHVDESVKMAKSFLEGK